MSRLLSSELSHWLAAGNIHALHKRLKAQRKQLPRNTACSNCRSKKIKCSGARPCEQCNLAGKTCDGAEVSQAGPAPSVAAEECLQLSTDYIPQPVPPAPDYVCGEGSADVSIGPVCDFLMKEVQSLGIPRDSVLSMFSHIPRKLRKVLARLSDVWLTEVSKTRDYLTPVMDQSDEVLESWNASKCTYMQVKYSEDWSMKICKVNTAFLKWKGLSSEEYGMRLEELGTDGMSCDSSEYRILCTLLEFYYQLARGLTSWTQVQISLCDTYGKNTERFCCERTTFRMHTDGLVITSVQLTPEEYDNHCRAQSLCPDRYGTSFLECNFPGRDLVSGNSKEIVEQEKISNLVDPSSPLLSLLLPPPPKPQREKPNSSA